MAQLKTCLLVSDDPDDHQILFEAIKEISRDIVLIVLLNGEHVIQVLKENKIQPDFILIDLELEGIEASFLDHLVRQLREKKIPIIIYTDNNLDLPESSEIVLISKKLSYSQILSRLKKLLTNYSN